MNLQTQVYRIISQLNLFVILPQYNPDFIPAFSLQLFLSKMLRDNNDLNNKLPPHNSRRTTLASRLTSHDSRLPPY